MGGKKRGVPCGSVYTNCVQSDACTIVAIQSCLKQTFFDWRCSCPERGPVLNVACGLKYGGWPALYLIAAPCAKVRGSGLHVLIPQSNSRIVTRALFLFLSLL